MPMKVDISLTACCVLGAEGSLELRKTAVPFDVILVTADGRVLYTCDGFTSQAEGYTYERVA